MLGQILVSINQTFAKKESEGTKTRHYFLCYLRFLMFKNLSPLANSCPPVCSAIRPYLASLLFILAFAGCDKIPQDYDIQKGDILFQSLPKNPLVIAIEGATGSPYSHCGLVVERSGEWFVLEAIGPVKETPLAEWIDQGRGDTFWAYRMTESLQSSLPEILFNARKHAGKDYDILYQFDNEEIYCSELIFNAVQEATGVELGTIEMLGDLNWKPYEQTIIAIQGYVPLDREMITPVSLSRAPELFLVYPKAK